MELLQLAGLQAVIPIGQLNHAKVFRKKISRKDAKAQPTYFVFKTAKRECRFLMQMLVV